ncbi:unnamed protein product [Didymodactylos carnosus]|uniref:Uncharacterized protein n=1 Tax=Didymodactylos carnosus TaxID=1234261 RepID=A0A815WE72_9BILA|nr:unnamed protein product [Didymodactylos carnosus]CAF1600651.1 unnamed protein product [Didymodactylos carnosus]CAF4402551.1 unnamed protein product [Didymodactylos carnosus]CAF4409060.1 unnamed protein product [Didymodactylos carnosus]
MCVQALDIDNIIANEVTVNKHLYYSIANDTFNDFLVWQQLWGPVVPLESGSCPIGMKVYSYKHSVGLAILFNWYEVSDKTRIQPLAKRKPKEPPKKVSTALNLQIHINKTMEILFIWLIFR